MRSRAVCLLVLAGVGGWGESIAGASCEPITYFAPDSGARVPPDATTYVFPSLSGNVVVRVTSEGREVEAYVQNIVGGFDPVIAVTPETQGLNSYTIEVLFDAGDELRRLELASYDVDSGFVEPDELPAPRLEHIEHVSNGGVFACARAEHLWLSLDVDAPAYWVEWARSERAYRDGDTHATIVKQAPGDGHVVRLGSSGCGQSLFTSSEEDELFVGITPLSLRSPDLYPAPARPMQIKVGAVPFRIERSFFPPVPGPDERPAAATGEATPSDSATVERAREPWPWGRIVTAAACVLGIWLVVGRGLAKVGW